MLYLVSMESVEAVSLFSSQQIRSLLEKVVIPSLEICAKLETEKKILAGGVVAGARVVTFIIEAESHDEVNKLLQGMPFWGLMKTQVTALQNFQTRLEADRRMLDNL